MRMYGIVVSVLIYAWKIVWHKMVVNCIAHNNDGFDKLYLYSNIKKYGINHYNKIGRSNSFTKYKYIYIRDSIASLYLG